MAKFQSIQSLRFFAAALVLASHIEFRLVQFGERYGFVYHRVGFSGRLGVDIFFVISGFIMAWLALDKFGRPGMPGQFIGDRITRIVPLYWICTTIAVIEYVAALHIGGDPDRAPVPTWQNIVKSYLFVPYIASTGTHAPALRVGWTLDFEMMFYAVLAACLLLPRRAGLIVLLLAFVAIYAVGFIPGAPGVLRIWSDPIIFEFLIGVGLALLRRHFGELVPVRAQPAFLLLPIIGLTLLGIGGEEGAVMKVIVAVTLVAFCVLGRDQSEDCFSQATARAGDWSFSLYLTHGFVLLLVGIIWHRLFGGTYLVGYVVCVIAGPLILCWASFTWLERPMTKRLRRWAAVRSIRQASAPAPLES